VQQRQTCDITQRSTPMPQVNSKTCQHLALIIVMMVVVVTGRANLPINKQMQ
jgi:hypothetical protein